MTGRRDDEEDDEALAPLSHNPFGRLEAIRDQLPAGEQAKKKVAKPPARAVIRLERKGHGGKEVTVVSHMELSPKDLEKWLKSLKSELGCGGAIDEGMIYLQGDQRERLPAVLTKRHVGKVTIG